MGWAERANPNSLWNRKRRPLVIPPVSKIVVSKKTGLWHRLINFIKRVIGQLSPQRATKPKEN